MSLKLKIAAVASLLVLSTMPVGASQPDKQLLGTYEDPKAGVATVKRVIISREKNGMLRVHAFLHGYPQDVSLGESVTEIYSARKAKNEISTIIATFSVPGSKPILVIHLGKFLHAGTMTYTCYMEDPDGSNVEFDGQLDRIAAK